MRIVYADTGAFIALLWRGDRAHERVRDHYRELRADGDVLLTSDLVVSETATRLRSTRGSLSRSHSASFSMRPWTPDASSSVTPTRRSTRKPGS